MLRGVFILIQIVVALSCCGQDIKAVWQAMPDSLVPYLDRNSRQQLVERYEMESKEMGEKEMGSVANRLDGHSRIDTLTSDYLLLRLNEQSLLELKLMPVASEGTGDVNGDTVVCVSRTVFGPLPESVVSIYTHEWVHRCDTVFKSTDLLQRPDTLSEAAFAELKKQVSAVMWQARLFPDHDNLVLTPSFLFVMNEEKERLKLLNMQIFLKFRGDKFN